MIRAAQKSDAIEIIALWNSMIRETDVTFTTDLKLGDDVEELISDPTRSVLIAAQGGVFAGFALIGPFRSGPGYAKTVEYTVYLLPSARGHGLGGALVRELILCAAKLGHHVMVGAISGGNVEAVKFHQSLGFEQVALMPQVGQKHGHWHDLILLQKII